MTEETPERSSDLPQATSLSLAEPREPRAAWVLNPCLSPPAETET